MAQERTLRLPPATKNSDVAPGKNPPNPPACPIWPSNPPRADIYCDGSMMCHPLTSPLAAKPSAWTDSPPLFFVYGEEMLGDEGRVVARRAARQGVSVRFEVFEAMPHVFAPILESDPAGKKCYESWAGWMVDVVAGNGKQKEGGVWVQAKTLKETPMEVQTLYEIEDEEVWAMMEKERLRRVRIFETEFKPNMKEKVEVKEQEKEARL